MKNLYLVILCMLLLQSVTQAETVTTSRRTAAYSSKLGNPIAGYFPPNSELEVLSRSGRFVKVRFISPSGQNVEALSLPQDLGLPLYDTAHRDASSINEWKPVDLSEVDRDALSPMGVRVLENDLFAWDHAQTPHFSIHFEHGMFARKVSRLAEFYYQYISKDLEGLKDRRKDRSHIYIFREREEWANFIRLEMSQEMQWAAAFVRGPEMYIQDFKNNKSAVNILAHEMTHLVVNRFFVRQPQLWLNEGLAEWYAAFAYAEFKGTYKTPGSVFRKVDNVMPLALLLESNSYPPEDLVSLYYTTSFYLVGYLRTEYPEEKFMTFLNAALNAKPMLEILGEVYQITDLGEFEEDFRDFCGVRH